MTSSQAVPRLYGTDVPLPQLESWLRSKLPAELSPLIERGMASARFNLAEQVALVSAADAYLKQRASSAGAGRP